MLISMKIVTLDPNQYRMWTRNAPVLVYTDTNEAVMVGGQPRHPTRDEITGILKAIKQKKLFSVEVDGKPCHYVNGREFLKRVFVRAHRGQPVQLRARNGAIIGTARPKFVGHDLANSEVLPTDKRPHKLAKVDPALIKDAPKPEVIAPQGIPAPEDCPECKDYAKPIGCRQDEHHFVCKYHDRWERLREQCMVASTTPPPAPETPSDEPSDDVMIYSLEDGTPIRQAMPEEIAEAKAMQDSGQIPIIKIGDLEYGIGNSSMTLE